MKNFSLNCCQSEYEGVEKEEGICFRDYSSSMGLVTH